MKRTSFFLALLAMLSTGLYSCSDKFDIAAPYKNITVVYGLLDLADTAHYIRIQKAFMDQNKSGLDMAKEPDSNFYASLNVTLKELSGSAVTNTFTLTRVDLTNEGYPKDTGTFFAAPNYAYKLKYVLNPDREYMLVVKNAATGETDSAVTPLINSNLPVLSFGVLEWQLAAFSINFAKYSDPLKSNIAYDVNFPANSGRGQVMIRFYWLDTNFSTHSAVRRSADFDMGEQDVVGGARTEFVASNATVYAFLKGELGMPGDNDYRYVDSCDMFVYAAGSAYANYNRLNNISGGLNANEIRPIWTNISGPNVMGLFSTRAHTFKYTIPISEDTRDSIAINPQTRDLHIRWQ